MQEDFKEGQFQDGRRLSEGFRKMKSDMGNRIVYFMLFIVLVGVI